MFIKSKLWISLVGILLGGCNTQPDPTPASTPDKKAVEEAIAAAKSIVTGEHLVTDIPQDWLKIRDSKGANLHISEFVPPDTVDTWTEKLSIEAMQGTDLPDPLEFLETVALDQSEFCGVFQDHPIFSGYENGYETAVRLLECRNNTRTGKSIVSMLKAIRGNTSTYTISRFWRLETPADEAGELDIDHEALGAWSNVLSDTYVCDASNPDHPCKRQESEHK